MFKREMLFGVMASRPYAFSLPLIFFRSSEWPVRKPVFLFNHCLGKPYTSIHWWTVAKAQFCQALLEYSYLLNALASLFLFLIRSAGCRHHEPHSIPISHLHRLFDAIQHPLTFLILTFNQHVAYIPLIKEERIVLRAKQASRHTFGQYFACYTL